MTGADLIVASLAAGATAGVTNTASSAIQDVYVALKDRLSDLLSGRASSRELLDAEETEPEAWQARFGDDLFASGAADDEQVLALARRLLELTDLRRAAKYQVDSREAKGVVIGDNNTQTNNFS